MAGEEVVETTEAARVTRDLVFDVGYFTHNRALRAIKDWLWQWRGEVTYRVEDDRAWMRGSIRIEVTGAAEDVDEILSTIEGWAERG